MPSLDWSRLCSEGPQLGQQHHYTITALGHCRYQKFGMHVECMWHACVQSGYVVPAGHAPIASCRAIDQLKLHHHGYINEGHM